MASNLRQFHTKEAETDGERKSLNWNNIVLLDGRGVYGADEQDGTSRIV